jgi:hypothetical protein
MIRKFGLAKIKPIPGTDHVMRHVAPARLRRDADDNIVGFLGQAFRLREGESYLSAAWIEHNKTGTKHADIAATILCFKAVRAVKNNDRFAVGNVSVIQAACSSANQKIRIVHEPRAGFECHAAIRQINTDDDRLLEILAEDAWAEMHK